MPIAAKRPCHQPGCPALVASGYCDKHKRPNKPGMKSRSAKGKKLYDLRIWRDKIRPAQLAREPWCRKCKAEGRIVRATDVDHVIDHDGDYERFVNGEKQSLCHACHSSKTANNGGFGR